MDPAVPGSAAVAVPVLLPPHRQDGDPHRTARFRELMRQSTEDPSTWIDYADFGERFVRHAVTRARIEAAVSGVAGRGMTIGPFSVGPAGLAGFVAEGSVGKPIIARSGPQVTFEVRVPVSLHVTITLGGQRLRLEAIVEIDLTLHARTAAPLLIVIDIPRSPRRTSVSWYGPKPSARPSNCCWTPSRCWCSARSPTGSTPSSPTPPPAAGGSSTSRRS